MECIPDEDRIIILEYVLFKLMYMVDRLERIDKDTYKPRKEEEEEEEE